jgi:outer membrane protein with beta-barrel domain
MKRILSIITIAILCAPLHGLSQKARVGIDAGATISNLIGKVGGNTLHYDSKGGVALGLMVDVPLGKTKFNFRPSVNYVQKGAVISEVQDQKFFWATRYAEFDFNFLYHTKGAKNISIFAGLGPALSLNLPSKKVTKTPDTKVEDNLLMDKESPAELKGIDWGVIGIAGLEMKSGAYLSFSYNHGIRNLVPGKDPVDEMRSTCFSIRLGVLLKNK